jgi:AraC family transcriptional regulator, transcriptional activator of pobA
MSSESKKFIPVKDKIEADGYVKVGPFRKEVRVTQPHKHKQYFELVYLSKGSGFHWIDEQQYAIEPPVAFFINCNQTHHWQITSEPAGYVAIFKHNFLQYSKDEMLKQLLQQIWVMGCLTCPDSGRIESVFELLSSSPGQGKGYQNHLLDGLLKSLISLIMESADKNAKQEGQGSHLYARFVEKLQLEGNLQRNLRHYATALHTTPYQLNLVCRQAIQKTALAVLDGYIIDEARRLLLFTGNRIAEIAYQLNFNDPSNFIKYFRKHLQITPERFRKKNSQLYHL